MLPYDTLHHLSQDPLIIKYQASNFNTFTALIINLSRVLESTVRYPTRYGLVRVKALDEHHLVWLLRILEVPSMSRVWLQRPGL